MILTSRAGSAGGPKPGRVGFWDELASPFKKLDLPNTRAACFGEPLPE